MKFTIIIPCYNAENWIAQSLTSALNQTYADLEVIFVDNESTDSSMDIAKEIKKDFPDLIISTAKNIYPYSYQEPVEEGLRISEGSYFTILGADDFIEEDYIQNIVNILSKSNKIKAMQSPIRSYKKMRVLTMET